MYLTEQYFLHFIDRFKMRCYLLSRRGLEQDEDAAVGLFSNLFSDFNKGHNFQLNDWFIINTLLILCYKNKIH